jgi:hypothetical protein
MQRANRKWIRRFSGNDKGSGKESATRMADEYLRSDGKSQMGQIDPKDRPWG